MFAFGNIDGRVLPAGSVGGSIQRVIAHALGKCEGIKSFRLHGAKDMPGGFLVPQL
jgi:hypothetical protein